MEYLLLYFIACGSCAQSFSSFPKPNLFIQSFEFLLEQFLIGNYSELRLGTNASVHNELFQQKELRTFWSEAETKCFGDMIFILRHLDSKGALQMLDSNGKVPSGTFLGDGLWMGNYQECRDIVMPVSDKDELQADIYGLYCVANWNVMVPSKFQMPLRHLSIKTGICIPSSCHSQAIGQDIDQIRYFIYRLPFFIKYESYLNLTSLNCKGPVSSLSHPAMLFIYFLWVYFVLVFIGSFITVIEYAYNLARSQHERILTTSYAVHRTERGEIITQEAGVGFHDNSILLENTEDVIPGFKYALLLRISKNAKKFFKCFCVFSNASKISDTKTSAKQFSCIHGIRFISMAWIILGHTYIHNINIVGNFMELLHSIDSLPFQIVTQGTFSVDTFFLISGFLLAYLFLEESDKRNGKINLLGLVLHRFLRITPVYMILIAYNTFIFEHTGSGPFWNDDSDIPVCKKYWWWNLMYINNFLPLNSMCVTWTWYLANDMQFFVFGILVLYILWRSRAKGLVFIFTVLILSWMITGYLTFKYDLIPLFYEMASALDYDTYRKRQYLTWDLIYTKPYCRIGPYMVGLLLAYFIHENKSKDLHLKLKYQVLGWCCASFCSLSVIYGIYHQELTLSIRVLYNALSRTSFSLGVSWVIYCCLTKNGGLINFILSSRVWTTLSRLTYCAYLFHPILMSWYFDSQKTAIYFTHMNRIMLYIGFLVVSYMMAFFVNITFEAPVINLEKIIIKKPV